MNSFAPNLNPPHAVPPQAIILRRLLGRREVKKVRCSGDTKLYADVKSGLFPPQLKDGQKSLWIEDEVAAVIAARIAGKTDDEIRSLVVRLVAARQHALEG